MSQMPTKFNVGNFTITPVRDGSMWFDGGNVFNMVPRPVWSKECPPDELNRVEVALNCLIVQAGEHTVLIDAGKGTLLDERRQNLYKTDANPTLIEHMRALKVNPEDITAVLLTHMHFDRVGSLTYRIQDSHKLNHSFIKAIHVVHREEWDYAHGLNELSKMMYKTQEYDMLFELGVMDFLTQDDEEVLPGIKMIHTGAHSPGHCIVFIENGGHKIVCPGDIIPTRRHLRTNWTSAFDYCPNEVVEKKKMIIDLVKNSDVLVYLSQEVEYPLGYIKEMHGKCTYVPI